MKVLFASLICLTSPFCHAFCDLLAPQVREDVLRQIREKTDADLTKAFLLNNFKSDKYSVFTVQFKKHDSTRDEDEIVTFTATVSCNSMNLPTMDSVTSMSIPLSSFPN